ncbi:MAG: class I SAM-dependent methyltransferase [Phycisphaerales bacterium]|nr:class I SAM-dependent methyltransferase [Phycisphaerales bacterium]
MNTQSFEAYQHAIDVHGAGFAATLWGSAGTQSLRFQVLVEMIGGLAGCSLLDLGCGDGALERWLIDSGQMPTSLAGLDAIGPQVDLARSQAADWSEYMQVDLLDETIAWPIADWVIVSGTLNTMTEFEVGAVLERAWSSSQAGLAFNLLSDRPSAEWDQRPLGPARRHDGLSWMAWALERTALVACRQDYLSGHDLTIVMKR